MFLKIKFFLSGALIVIFLLIAYTAGQSSRPDMSFDMAYDIVKSKENGDLVEQIETNKVTKKSYIPAYSHIYISHGKPIEMAITLSLRNTDAKNNLKIDKIFYYNTQGKLIRKYLNEGLTLKPLETKEIFIKWNDVEGGSGANFIVEYQQAPLSSRPIFETIMAATSENKESFVFSSRGKNI